MGSQVKRLPRSWLQYSELVQKNPASNNQWTNKLFFEKILGYSNSNVGVCIYEWRQSNENFILKNIKIINYYVKVKIKEFMKHLFVKRDSLPFLEL